MKETPPDVAPTADAVKLPGQEVAASSTRDETASAVPAQTSSIHATGTQLPITPKPAPKVWKLVAPGIYRYLKAGTLYERPWINGRRTLRSLGTTDLQAALNEFRHRRGLGLEAGRGSRSMMKAVLEFNLPEAQECFEASAKGLEWKSVVAELDRRLCSWIKKRQHFATPAKALSFVRQQLHQRLAEKGLRLG